MVIQSKKISVKCVVNSIRVVLITATLILFSAACLSGGLNSLALKAGEIHPLLATRSLDSQSIRHISLSILQENPQHSADVEFIEAILGGSSQGRLGKNNIHLADVEFIESIVSSGSHDSFGKYNIHSALFALYYAEKDVGFYGLEAKNTQDADRLEVVLRETWSNNVSLDRARVHRKGLILMVIWHDGVSREVWDAVNISVSKQLDGRA